MSQRNLKWQKVNLFDSIFLIKDIENHLEDLASFEPESFDENDLKNEPISDHSKVFLYIDYISKLCNENDLKQIKKLLMKMIIK